jgi:hypothetical protein
MPLRGVLMACFSDSGHHGASRGEAASAGRGGLLENTLCWFVDEDAQFWSLFISTTLAFPREKTQSELIRAARSFRLLE